MATLRRKHLGDIDGGILRISVPFRRYSYATDVEEIRGADGQGEWDDGDGTKGTKHMPTNHRAHNHADPFSHDQGMTDAHAQRAKRLKYVVIGAPPSYEERDSMDGVPPT